MSYDPFTRQSQPNRTPVDNSPYLSQHSGMQAPPDDKPPIEWPLALLILVLACLLVGAFLWMKYATDVP